MASISSEKTFLITKPFFSPKKIQDNNDDSHKTNLEKSKKKTKQEK